ncbi:BON domain-containing protein [Nitrospira sp. NS4]|uniref:BON domain-containing protein n=1 Tax=Nitrospira sp. NS4 TaxID=3414498 RepID=UPI003C304CCD
MGSHSRALLLTVATVALLTCWAGTAFSEQQDKEKPPEKSSSKPPQIQAAPDSQTEPPKLSIEPKPQPSTVPPAKADTPSNREDKEKDTAKKPVGSLAITVKLALLADSRLFHYEIEAGEDEKSITLTGHVASEEDKTAAAEVARAVPGVKIVINKLDVERGLAQALTKKQDEIITLLIKERFAKSATLKSAHFDVKTDEGIVSLSGAVRFQVIALEAAETARQVPGVRAVKTEKIRLEGES